MRDLNEFYILGRPIKTKAGHCRFLFVNELPDYVMHLNCVRMTKDHIVKTFYDSNMEQGMIDFVSEMTLLQMVQKIGGVKQYYEELFNLLFETEFDFSKLDEETFKDIRSVVLTMCVIKEEVINPNPEIQAWIEKSKNFKALAGDTLTFTDIVTSVGVFGGYTYAQINDMTLYQLYMSFYRIGKFKDYDTTTLFSTVSTDKINVENWCKNINLFKDENKGLTKEEFNKMSGSIF